jgi:hypothetical protein
MKKIRPAILQFFTLPPPVRLGAVILATVALGLLAGCSTAGLNVSWDFQASYNREVSPLNLDIRVVPPKAPASAPKGTGI